MLTHPFETGSALAVAFSHPNETFVAIRSSLLQTYDTIAGGGTNPSESSRAIGRLVGGIEFGLATGGATKSVAILKWNNQLPRGQAVLGHYPDYIKLADQIGARRFSIPEKIWNRLSEAKRWEANKKFLDRVIKRGDDVVLSNLVQTARPGSALANEIKYLLRNGYKVVENGWKLTKKRWG